MKDKKSRNKLDEFELLKLMKAVGGFQDDILSPLAEAAMIESSNNETIEFLLQEGLHAAILEKTLDARLFATPTGLADGPIILGYSLESSNHEPVGIYPVELTRMVLVVGTHGSGKTTVVRNLLRFVIENYS